MGANMDIMVTRLKRSVYISRPKKGDLTECVNYHTVALISHATKINHPTQIRALIEKKGVCQMFKVTLEKAKKPKTFWVIENAKEFQKEVNLSFTDYQNASDCVNPDFSLPREGSRKNIVMLLVLQWRLCLTSAS